jgi:hypothetical protein
MDDKLNELLRAGKTEQEQEQEQPEIEIKREPVAYVEKDTTTGEYTKRLEYITRPVAKQPVKKLSAFGRFKALIKRNKLANGAFFLLFTVIVMVLLVVIAHLLHIKLTK